MNRAPGETPVIRTVAGGRRLFVAIVTSVMAATCIATQAADPTLSRAQELGLQKRGEGRLSFFGISLYTASLWTETAAAAPDPSSEPVLLRINYERNISRDRIMKITREEWDRLQVAAPAQQQVWLQKLESLLPDIRRGDELSSLVVPGEATRFYFSGAEIGRVEDPAFGEAFLAIWLDPRTRASKLRTALLAQQ